MPLFRVDVTATKRAEFYVEAASYSEAELAAQEVAWEQIDGRHSEEDVYADPRPVLIEAVPNGCEIWVGGPDVSQGDWYAPDEYAEEGRGV